MSDGMPMSFGERLSLLPLMLQSLIHFLLGLVFAPFEKRSAFASATTLVLRNLFDKSTIAQGQWLLPQTETIYDLLGSADGPNSPRISLPSGAKGLWIGRKEAARVIIYFHGGGYIIPATYAYFRWLKWIRQQLSAVGQDTSVLLLSYTIAPHGKYPLQLTQAISLLDYVLNVEGIAPSKILVGGDSAGGNLTLGVLSHLLHPHPSIPAITLKEPLLGTFLVSPWVSCDYDGPTFRPNHWDMLTKRALFKADEAFLVNQAKDNYNEAVRAEPAWWTLTSKVTQSVFIWYGADEALRGSIEHFISALEKSISVTAVRAPKALHIGPIVEHYLPSWRSRPKDAIVTWLQQVMA